MRAQYSSRRRHPRRSTFDSRQFPSVASPLRLLASSRSLLVLALLLAFTLPARGADTFRLTILHTNDLHGMMRPFDYADDGGYFGHKQADAGGLARRATLIKRIRKATPNPVLVIDAGDVFTRGPWAKQWYGVPEIEAMNLMGYDALTIGNNEFEAGPDAKDRMLVLMRRSRFPWLAANVTVGDTGVPVEGVHPFVVRAFGEVRVGILGLTAPRANEYEWIKGWHVGDPVAAARQWVPQARRESDLLIAVVHLGTEEGPAVVAQVDGIAAMIGGDSHSFVAKPILTKSPSGADIPYVQAGERGVVLGRLDLTFAREGGWHLVKAEEHLIPITRDVPEDPEVRALLDRYLRPLPVTLLPRHAPRDPVPVPA